MKPSLRECWKVNKEKYQTIRHGLKVTLVESGVRTLMLGWAPTAIGYSLQGSCKYGFYELFKKLYSEALGEERTYQHRTELYLAAAASAEFLADIALSPMEACKVSPDSTEVRDLQNVVDASSL